MRIAEAEELMVQHDVEMFGMQLSHNKHSLAPRDNPKGQQRLAIADFRERPDGK